MNRNEMDLSLEEEALLDGLLALRAKLDAATLSRYRRINPFAENLSDWHEKGSRFAGEGSVIYDSATLIGDLQLGDFIWIGEGCMVDGSGGLKIGDHTVLSSGTHVYTHDTVKWALSGGLAPYLREPVEIGSCVFVGAQAVITAGVTIGDHALVCANATVVSDVEPYSIVAGTPARRIGWVEVDGAEVTYHYDREQ